MIDEAKGIGIGPDTMGYADPPAERPDTAHEKAEYALDWLRKIVAAGNVCGVETELDLAYEHGPYPEQWVDFVLRVSFQGDTTCEPEVVWLHTMRRIVQEAERRGGAAEMKTVTVYETSDGMRFDAPDEAAAHDALVAQVEHAMQPLGPRPKLGDGRWKQHAGFDCRLARRRVVTLYVELYPDDAERWNLEKSIDAIDPRTHVIGRILDGNGPLARAWYRLSCINWATFREYDQPYYAMHPEEAGTEQAT